jgi:short-subunit dehydrogenase
MKFDVSTQVCIFGVGALFHSCYNQILLLLGRKPDLLSDNASNKWGEEFNGIPCVSPSELATAHNIIVLVAVRNFEGISEQLEGLGITEVYSLNFDKGYNVITNLQKISDYKRQLNNEPIKTVSLQGRWAVVTGSSRGIGFQIAKTLADLGVNIVAIASHANNCQEIESYCKQQEVKCLSVGVNLESDDFLPELITAIDEYRLSIDILVNCAGVAPRGLDDIWKQSVLDYQYAYAVNTIAPIILSSHFIPKMISKGFGRVINVSSNIHHRPAEQAYACSKAALDKYIYDLLPTLEGTGVLLSVVDPGWVKTDMGGSEAPHSPESVVPGAILGMLMTSYTNGQWFVAQDYAGMTFETALMKAEYICRRKV